MQSIVDTQSLIWLLKCTQRRQTISGKNIPQVSACMLNAVGGRMSTCSLTKDGVSSVGIFSIPSTGEAKIPVSDIETMLGILKYHGNALTLTYDNDKLKLKSRYKQTTLTASENALAFPHSPTTLNEWSNTSITFAGKLNVGNEIGYTMNDGSILQPACSWESVDAVRLFEAVRCDEMNGQKLNTFTFKGDENGLSVVVGKELKGRTEYELDRRSTQWPFMATYQGGFNNLFANINGKINLYFFDFTQWEQGVKLLITLGDGDFIFQSALLGDEYI